MINLQLFFKLQGYRFFFYDSNSDIFQEAFRVLKLPYKKSLSELTDQVLNDAKSNLPAFQLVNSSPVVINGVSGHTLVYKYNDDKLGTLQQMVILITKNGTAYISGYVSESPNTLVIFRLYRR